MHHCKPELKERMLLIVELQYISQLISSTKIAFLLNIEAARAEVMDMDTLIDRFAEMKARGSKLFNSRKIGL